MPCLSSPMERPSTIRDTSEWDSMLMKPGATARPFASIDAGALADLRSPMAVMRSPVIPMSACTGGLPVPSYTSPPLMITSNVAGGDPDRCPCAAAIVTGSAINSTGASVEARYVVADAGMQLLLVIAGCSAPGSPVRLAVQSSRDPATPTEHLSTTHPRWRPD